MRPWLRGKPAGLFSFAMIAGLVAGGLGWATAAALRLEREQLEQRVESERGNLLRLALWRLDSRVSPLLAREDSRPFNHYSAVYPLPLALNNFGVCCSSGSVLEPSPLLNTELPPWMLLHFQTNRTVGWESPQVLSPKLTRLLNGIHGKLTLNNVTPARQRLLAELTRQLPVADLLERAAEHTQPATVRDTAVLLAQNNLDNAVNPAGQSGPYLLNLDNTAQMAQGTNSYPNQALAQEYNTRRDQQNRLLNEGKSPKRVPKDLALNTVPGNGANWFAPLAPSRSAGTEVLVHLSPMVPLWLETPAGPEHLVLFRLVRIEDTDICQGIVLDGPALQEMLAHEVADLFPEAKVVPMREAVPSQPERTMTALPLQLDPGPSASPADPGWTPLRIGLALAWLAALFALLAVGLGGWSLLDLSERRIRFVSAVTHELRTPLTTLRLYLDMLVNGLVRDDKQRNEYIHTLHAETDRLNRLVGNVLDFSRLESQRPRLHHSQVFLGDLLEQVRAAWAGRCQDAEKELIVENTLPADAALWTDRELVRQVLGNLIDNACKYSRGAEDRRLWLRAERGPTAVRDRGSRARRAGEGPTIDLPRLPSRTRRRRDGRRRRFGAGAGAALDAAARRPAEFADQPHGPRRLFSGGAAVDGIALRLAATRSGARSRSAARRG